MRASYTLDILPYLPRVSRRQTAKNYSQKYVTMDQTSCNLVDALKMSVHKQKRLLLLLLLRRQELHLSRPCFARVELSPLDLGALYAHEVVRPHPWYRGRSSANIQGGQTTGQPKTVNTHTNASNHA